MSKTWDISHLTENDMIVVKAVAEHEDGSATVELSLGANTLRLLLELGFKTLVTEAIKSGDANGETEA
jgi:hypothetical protein